MTQATILAIETATSCCSVALACAGQITEKSRDGINVHSQVVLDMARELLGNAGVSVTNLDAVAVGQGPGSFTGLRIGVGVAQGIAYGVECPMIGVSSLDALAYQAPRAGIVLAGIDARMGEVYWAQYDKFGDGIKRIDELHVTPPNAIKLNLGSSQLADSLQLVGNAWVEYQALLPDRLAQIKPIEEAMFPRARALLRLAQLAYNKGDTISARDFAPEYVRNNVAS